MDDSGAASVRAIMHWQYRTICRGHNSILHNLYDLVGPRMHDYISFYGLRAYGRLFDGGPIASSQVHKQFSFGQPMHTCSSLTMDIQFFNHSLSVTKLLRFSLRFFLIANRICLFQFLRFLISAVVNSPIRIVEFVDVF